VESEGFIYKDITSHCKQKTIPYLIYLFKRYWGGLLLGLIVFSCEMKIEKQFVFPESLSFGNFEDSSITQKIIDEDHYQIITVIQGECPPCIMELQSWSNLMAEFKDFPVSFIFVIHARQFFNFEEISRKIGFDYPVIFDPDNLFMKSNFPENYNQYPTFLCKDLRIIATGNPVRSEKIKEEFISLIDKP
jgi:hypothetical protein